MPVGNPYEEAKRSTKAAKLAIWLRDNGYTWHDVQDWGTPQWQTAAEFAEIKPPSPATQNVIKGYLFRWLPADDPARSPITSDPFEGLATVEPVTLNNIRTGGPADGVGTIEAGEARRDFMFWTVLDRDGDAKYQVSAWSGDRVEVIQLRDGSWESLKLDPTEAVLVGDAMKLAAAWAGHGPGSPGEIQSGLGPEQALAADPDA